MTRSRRLAGTGPKASTGPVASAVRVADSFAVLGLDIAVDITDDDVRAAWRRIASATHPDRADGGDPERFALAAAAYTELRTPSGRGEARAAIAQARAVHAGRASRGNASARTAGRHRATPAHAGAGLPGATRWLARQSARVRAGRPVRLTARVLVAATAGTLAILAAGPMPAAPAVGVGALTWLVVTARRDLG